MSETQYQRLNVIDSMSETQCQRLNVIDPMSETQCQRLNVRDPMSETQCNRLNVRDPMSETQCHRFNVRDPMSETQCQRLNVRVGFTNLVIHLCYTSHFHVQCDIGVRRDSGFVVFSFPSLDCCRSSVNADRLLTASMSWVLFFGTEAQSSLVQFEMPGGHLCGTCGGAIMMGFRRIWGSLSGYEGRWVDMRVTEWIWGSLSGYEGRWVDMTVVKLTCIDLSELVVIVRAINQQAIDALWPTLGGVTTPTHLATVIRICKSIWLGKGRRLKWGESEKAKY